MKTSLSPMRLLGSMGFDGAVFMDSLLARIMLFILNKQLA